MTTAHKVHYHPTVEWYTDVLLFKREGMLESYWNLLGHDDMEQISKKARELGQHFHRSNAIIWFAHNDEFTGVCNGTNNPTYRVFRTTENKPPLSRAFYMDMKGLD
jgi:hypothetical protein